MPLVPRALAVAALALSISVAARAGDPITLSVTGSGPAIVFIPGAGAPASVWDEVVQALAPRYTCITVSIAGFGNRATAPADTAAVEAAIVQQVERGGWRRPVLVGHSYGGMLALSLAASHSSLFGKIVIVDAYPFPMGQVQPSMTPEAARQQASAVRSAVLAMTAEAFGQQQRAVAAMSVTDPARADEVAGWTLSSDRAAVADAQFMMLSSDLRPLLARIPQPLLAIGTWRGREPFGFSHERTAGTLEAQYAGAPVHRTIVNDTARHYVMLDDPAWLARTIAEFAGR